MGRMRGATCFLFKIFQTNRLLPLPCFPLWGKCLRKQTIEVNFNFLTLIQPSPWGRASPVSQRIVAKPFEFKTTAFDIAFPLGGRWTKRSFGRMRGATCFLFKIFQTNRLLPLPCFPLWGKCLRKQTIEVNFNFLTLIQPSPWGRASPVSQRIVAKPFEFKTTAFDIAFPLGGRWTKRSFGRMRGATCFL